MGAKFRLNIVNKHAVLFLHRAWAASFAAIQQANVRSSMWEERAKHPSYIRRAWRKGACTYPEMSECDPLS